MKDSVKTKYEKLVQEVKSYISALKNMKAQTAGTFPAYGQPGEENSATKSSPNVVFIKDLITQVDTANKLGFNTHLVSNNSGELTINFVEKTPRIPFSLEYL